MARTRLVWTMLVAAAGLGNLAALAECRFRDVASEDAVTYRFESAEVSSGRELRVAMTFRVAPGTPTEVEVPSEFISGLRVRGARGMLQRDASGRTMVTAAESGPVTLVYTLRNGWAGPLVHPHEFQPVVRPDYIEITGDKALVWLKRDHDARVTANFDWQALPQTWALATSFGTARPLAPADGSRLASTTRDRCQTYRGAWTRVNQALFAAGDFRLHPFRVGQRPAMLAARGTWTFSDEEAANQIGRTIGLVRRFWHDDDFPYFLATLQPFEQDHGSSDGTAYTDAFWMYVSRKDDIHGLLSQLAHETFHAWSPLKMGDLSAEEFAKIKWFKEGVTEYYAQKLTEAGGELSAQRLVSSMNRDLLAFPGSSSEYVRGRVIALWLDATIQERSRGKSSLDDVMFRMVRDRRRPLTEQRIFNTVAPYLSADQLALLQRAADQGGDLAAPATIPGLGSCYRASHAEFPAFDAGFDFGASRAAKVVLGVNPSGPAYKAGLRDGQPMVAWEMERGNVEREAEVTVRVRGREERIGFRPVGKPVLAWQYVSANDKACSAGS